MQAAGGVSLRVSHSPVCFGQREGQGVQKGVLIRDLGGVHGVLHMEGEGREGHAGQGAVEAIDLELLSGGQVYGGRFGGEVEAQFPRPISQRNGSDRAVRLDLVDHCGPEDRRHAAGLEGLIHLADFQILHGLVGRVLIIGAKCGRSTLGLLRPLHRVLLERDTLASAISPEGSAVLPLDGVEDGVGILIGQDRVGCNRQAVLGAADAQGGAQLFQ